MANFRELQDMNEKIQTGMQTESNDEFDSLLGNILSNRKSVQEETAQMDSNSAIYFNDNTERAIDAGFGSKFLDKRVNIDEFLADPEDARAHAQSGFSQIINGVAKMGTTAAITFADNTVGLVAGIGNIAKDAVDGGEFHPLDSFINNEVSQGLDELREYFETVFPNYRTIEERDLFLGYLNANFWGDSFLKNLGFMFGSGLSMKGVTAIIGKMSAKKLAPDILKGAMAAAKGDAAAVKEMDVLANMFKTGKIDAKVLANNSKNAAKRLVYQPATTMFISGALGAVGESRMEAIGTAKELADELTNFASEAYDQKVSSIDDVILAEHPELLGEYDYVPSYDENGNMSFERKAIGQNALAMRQALLDKYEKEYNDNIAFIDGQAQNAAAGTFLANIPVLTLSNIFQFGKMLSGGYKNAVIKNAVKGGLKKEANGVIKAAYEEGMSAGVKAALGSAKVGLSEGGEELMQRFISETEKYKGRKNIAAFNNDAYDDDAIDTFGEHLSSLFDTVKDQVKDPDTWQEFVIGAFTGLFGMPGITRVSDANGNKRFSGTWNGGAYGEYRDSKKQSAVVREAVKAMNDRINSKDFTDNWHSIIRHSLYGKQAEEAAANKDEFTWHTVDDKMLINDVLLFARNGRIDDLLDIADSFARMDEKEVDDVKSLIQNAAEQDSPYINMSDKEIIDPIKRRAEQVKTVINDYKRAFNDLVIRKPEISDKFAEEILFTEMQLARFESRYHDIANEYKDKIGASIDNMKAYSVTDKDGNKKVVKDEEQLNEKKEVLRGHLESLFGYNVNSWNQIVRELTNSQLQSYADELSAFAVDNSDKQKIKDLAKLSISRSNFYDRLRILEDITQDQFDKQAETHEKHNEKRLNSRVQQAGNNVSTPNEARELIKTSQSLQTPEESKKSMREAAEKNNVMDKLLTKRKYFDQIKGNIPNDVDTSIGEVAEKALDYVYANDIELDDFLNGNLSSEQNAAFIRLVEPEFDNLSTVEQHDALTDRLKRAADVLRKTVEKTNSDNAVTGSKQGIPVSKENAVRNGKVTEEMIAELQREIMNSFTSPFGTDGIVGPQPAIQTSNPFAKKVKPSTETDGELLSLDTDAKNTIITEDEILDEQKAVAAEQIAERDELKEQLGVDIDAPADTETDISVKPYSFLQPAFGQFAVDDMRAARSGLIVELTPFGESNREYADMYNALANRGTFEYVNEGNIKNGDDIYFVIDPSFPKYENKNDNTVTSPILMMHRKDGKEQIVGIVPSENRIRYDGIQYFYDEFDKEYDKFYAEQSNNNKVFVFSKSTKVKAIRQGFRSFVYLKDGNKFLNDIPITQCRDYEHMKDSPIIYKFPNDVQREEKIVRLGVEKDNNKIRKDDVVDEISKYSGFAQNDKSGIYLLAKNAHGYYSPVKLSLARYNEETEAGSYLDNRIKSILGKFFEVGGDGVINIMSKDGRNAVRKELNSLMRYDNIMFNFLDVDGSPEIRINEVTRNKETQESVSKIIARFAYGVQNDDVMIEAMANVLKSRNKPVAVKPGIANETLHEFMDNGLVLTNAQYLSPVGATFYTNPFNVSTNDFSVQEEAKPESIDVTQDRVYTDNIEAAKEYEPTGGEGDIEVEDFEDSEFEEFEPDSGAMLSIDTEYTPITFDGIDEETRGYLKAKGYTKERFDSMPEALKEQAVECAAI